jgi:hypothetical protein
LDADRDGWLHFEDCGSRYPGVRLGSWFNRNG